MDVVQPGTPSLQTVPYRSKNFTSSLFDTFGSEVNPISSEIPSETKEGGSKKNPKENQKVKANIHKEISLFFWPKGDFSCLSKGTVIQDALHLKCAICGNWHLIRGLKHRQKKMVCVKEIP